MTQIADIGQATATAPLDAASAAKAQERVALQKAAKSFEAIFMRQLVGSMRKSGLGESIDGSSAVDQFQEMSDANMADGLASHAGADGGGLGIAQLILQQLDKR
jgi:flagellar protein FlgJ